MVQKQDGNVATLSFSEQTAVGAAATGPWYAREPNTVGDFGGTPSTVERKPIGTRKVSKGTITGIAPKVVLNEDFTNTNQMRILQTFTQSVVRQKFSTQPINGTQTPITSVATSDDSFNAGAGLGTVLTKNLLYASGFTNGANNGLKTVATVAAAKITVSENLVDEGAPPAAAKLEVCGVQFAAGDVALTYAAPVLTLTSTAFDFTTLGLVGGEWVQIGGDAAAMHFATAVNGYARLAATPTAHAMVFDKTTFTPGADTGAAKTIQLFYGTVLKDETADTTKVVTWEAALGNDGIGIQSELVPDCFGNEIILNMPKKEKLNIDLNFIGTDHTTRSGTLGLTAGTRVAAFGEPAFNTSSSLLRGRLAAVDPLTLNPTRAVGYVDQSSITINNGATLDEAEGRIGGFDVTLGDFMVTGKLNCFFTTVAAIASMRANASMTYDKIYAQNNAGFLFDLPLITLGGTIPKIEKNKAIMIPIDAQGVVGPLGHTVLFNWFPYLPTSAMPVGGDPT